MVLSTIMLGDRKLAIDTTPGVMAHAALAFGLVAVSFPEGIRVDLMALLFGDILAVSRLDLGIISIGALLICVLIYWR